METEPQTRHDASVSEPGEVIEPRENATELQEASSYTTRTGRRVIKSSRYGEQRTVKPLIVKAGCYMYPSHSTILFLFVYSTSVVFMLLHHLPKSIPFISSTNIPFIHLIYHSPSLSYLPYLVKLMLHCHSALLSRYIKNTIFA